MDDDELDVALDAWMVGDVAAIDRLGHGSQAGRVRLAERLHRRGAIAEARALYEDVRRQNPRIILRGDARVLAQRTRERLREEVSDLMQWNPRGFRIGFSKSPSLWIRRFDEAPSYDWRAWWTEEDALAEALREAWRQTMADTIEDARRTDVRVDRREVDAYARQRVELLHTGIGVGELLGTPGPLRTTVSGFVIVQGF
jgi:hypothetical protein